MIFVASS